MMGYVLMPNGMELISTGHWAADEEGGTVWVYCTDDTLYWTLEVLTDTAMISHILGLLGLVDESPWGWACKPGGSIKSYDVTRCGHIITVIETVTLNV